MEAVRPGLVETPKGLVRFVPALLMGAAMWAVLIIGTMMVF